MQGGAQLREAGPARYGVGEQAQGSRARGQPGPRRQARLLGGQHVGTGGELQDPDDVQQFGESPALVLERTADLQRPLPGLRRAERQIAGAAIT